MELAGLPLQAAGPRQADMGVQIVSVPIEDLPSDATLISGCRTLFGDDNLDVLPSPVGELVTGIVVGEASAIGASLGYVEGQAHLLGSSGARVPLEAYEDLLPAGEDLAQGEGDADDVGGRGAVWDVVREGDGPSEDAVVGLPEAMGGDAASGACGGRQGLGGWG